MVRDKQGKLIAGFSGKQIGNVLEVDLLYTDQAYRGKGYGRKFIDFLSGLGFDHNCDVLSLWSGDWHSHGFYRHLGFQEYGQVHNFPADHKIFYFSKPIENDSGFKSAEGVEFTKENKNFYDELLPLMQQYELQQLCQHWPEEALAIHLKDARGRPLATALFYTLWNHLYCDGLAFSEKATPSARKDFVEQMIGFSEDVRFSGLRFHLFPWQSPDIFEAAAFQMIGALPNREPLFRRQTFVKEASFVHP